MISNFGNETIDSQLELNSNTCHVCTRKEGGSNRAPCTNAFSVQPTVDVGRTVLAAKHIFNPQSLAFQRRHSKDEWFGKKHKIQILDLVLWADTSQCVLMSTGRFTHPCPTLRTLSAMCPVPQTSKSEIWDLCYGGTNYAAT